ncbi:MAG: Altered inheritance of mitochondria protein 24, mitochondrial [Chrysothrix sp. TS-e1954]|nr:MAG: Altered inheritance of mitochondria protein 24, mitochondrial [Chrysothrix sp. TS-e1954]
MRRRALQLLLRDQWQSAHIQRCTRRSYQLQAAPSISSPSYLSSEASQVPDAQFEVLGNTSSLLAVNLTASQRLYTRRGTLVAVSGSPENATSSLSSLSPLTRGFPGIPFLYQKLSSTSPLNILIAAAVPHSSFAVLNLDGRVDWKIVQRKALLAWTGHTLAVKPGLDTSMSLAHWGSSTVTGRGLVAVVGTGQVYQIKLVDGEQYVAHPSNVVAYTINRNSPQPYRFKSSSLKLQIPSLDSIFPRNKFFQTMLDTTTFKTLANLAFQTRTWTRRTIWGDRLFLRFHGPTTILLQSRGSRLRDVLSSRDVNEIADATAGLGRATPTLAIGQSTSAGVNDKDSATSQPAATSMSYARVEGGGKIAFRTVEVRDTPIAIAPLSQPTYTTPQILTSYYFFETPSVNLLQSSEDTSWAASSEPSINPRKTLPRAHCRSDLPYTLHSGLNLTLSSKLSNLKSLNSYVDFTFVMETYIGHVRTPADSIILFEACRLGLLPRVQRRLSEKERQQIKSGSVFVWDEREAGMRRWTDGKSWSASRVHGSFLTYREMEGKRGNQANARNNSVQEAQDTASSPTQQFGAVDAPLNFGNGSRYGMDTPDGYRYKVDGLTKQSFSITTSNGQRLHLICYFTRQPPGQAVKLLQPTNDPQIKHIRPAKGMYPESSVQDGNHMPAMTQSPMIGAPYAASPNQHSPGHAPQYTQVRGMHPHSPAYGWPPSPLSTPPTHYSPYQNGYANGSGHSPAYYAHAASHQRVHAPQGQTAFDRAPPPLSGVGMPQPPPGQHYGGYTSTPPTSAPSYQHSPGYPAYFPTQTPAPSYSPQHQHPNHYPPPPRPESSKDPRHSQVSAPSYQPQPYSHREHDSQPIANGQDPPGSGGRTASSSGIIPSIGALINNAEPSHPLQNGHPPSHSTVALDAQKRDTTAGQGDSSNFREDARALRQLDRAFAP